MISIDCTGKLHTGLLRNTAEGPAIFLVIDNGPAEVLTHLKLAYEQAGLECTVVPITQIKDVPDHWNGMKLSAIKIRLRQPTLQKKFPGL